MRLKVGYDPPTQFQRRRCGFPTRALFYGVTGILLLPVNMDRRKRSREDLPTADSNHFNTPEERVYAGLSRDGDLRQWSVEDTCGYLRLEGLGIWEEKFRGSIVVITVLHVFTN